MQKAKLVLSDGTTFTGTAAGYQKSTAGEVVFATGMVGYDLSLTDPSYKGQILTFTCPLIGNWGVPPKDNWESDKIQVAGLVISELTKVPSHYSSTQTLDHWLKSQKIPAVVGIDTRKLTQKLRAKGVMLGKIVIDSHDVDFVDPNERNLVVEVSISEPKIHLPNPKLEIRNPKQYQNTKEENSKHLDHSKFENSNLFRASHFRRKSSYFDIRVSPIIGLLNCGAKANIAKCLTKRGATVYEIPWNFDPFENDLRHLDTPGVKSGRRSGNTPGVNLDGLVISNGPGNPKMAKESIYIIRKALDKKLPTFGICLGNQLLALAAGGDTYKLKFGHRAQNQPTIEEGDLPAGRQANRCYITTQNHGFAVDEKKLPKGFRRWFYNANDGTNEGIIHESLPFFSVQFHPEAAPGPTDTEWLFDYFLEKVHQEKGQTLGQSNFRKRSALKLSKKNL